MGSKPAIDSELISLSLGFVADNQIRDQINRALGPAIAANQAAQNQGMQRRYVWYGISYIITRSLKAM